MLIFKRALTLDDLYKMTASIYSDKNVGRSATATFSHFVEVCGMLTIHDRNKKREGVDVTEALCKSLGWYFPLLAKMGIRSAEQVIFRKFPGVCPYCREAPHNEANCKLVRGTAPTLDHSTLATIFHQNWEARPEGLNAWQMMFNKIYPRDLSDRGRSSIGLLEELGELAEAIRVFDQHPKYFLGEAADTFSYLMGIANEHTVRELERDRKFSLEDEFLRRYPGLCVQCGSDVCICPQVPEATVGRMAKEIAIAQNEHPFIEDAAKFGAEGKAIGREVLESLGGHKGLSAELPLERGDANKAIVTLCLRIADAIECEDGSLARTLRSEAVRIATDSQRPGTPKKKLELGALLDNLNAAWKSVGGDLRLEIRQTEGLVGEFGDILDTIKVLFVECSPTSETHIRTSAELRAIREALGRNPIGDQRVNIIIEHLTAATATDFRRALLEGKFEIVHFAGHADADSLIFETEVGESNAMKLRAVAEIIDRNKSIKGVILNGCKSVKKLTEAMGSFTIGMQSDIDDCASIAFSRGFYDALRLRKSPEASYEEGVSAVRGEGLDREADKVRFIDGRTFNVSS